MARIAGINIPQNKVVSIALTYIHGIGLHSSKKICKKLAIAESKRVNELSEEEVLKIREFIDAILEGLYSLKKTYPDTKEIIAKVDSIILTLIDFKDKTEDYIKQKGKGIKLLVGRSLVV